MLPAINALSRSASVLAGDQFHHQIVHTLGLLQPVDRGNVGVVQRSQHSRFALKRGQAVGIVDEGRRQHLEGYVAPELGVVRLVHLAHAARVKEGNDLVGANLTPYP